MTRKSKSRIPTSSPSSMDHRAAPLDNVSETTTGAERSDAEQTTPAGAHQWIRDPAGAARHDLRLLSPGLCSLAYCPTLPDRILQDILEWGALLEQGKDDEAFSIEWLNRILPALTVSFLASFTYELSESPKSDRPKLRMHDQGTGHLVRHVSGLIIPIALALGRKGEALLDSARADFDTRFDQMLRLMEARKPPQRPI